MQTPPLFVFDGWSDLNKLEQRILILGSFISLDESKQVSDKNIMSVLWENAWDCIKSINIPMKTRKSGFFLDPGFNLMSSERINSLLNKLLL